MLRRISVNKTFTWARQASTRTSASVPSPIRNPPLPPLKPFINNEFVDNASGEKFETICPIDGSAIAEIQHSDEETVNRAVAAAKAAFAPNSPWRKMEPTERGKLLWKLADLVERDSAYLASLDVLECGKIYTTTWEWDVMSGVNNIRYFSTLPWSDVGETINLEGGYIGTTFREPIGVAGCISSWNFPIHVGLLKTATALAPGCTAVLKPSMHSSLSQLHLARLVAEAGFPPGVYNVVPGKTSIGRQLSSHPDIGVMTVTASTKAGIDVYQRSAPTLKRMIMNLGAKSPFIVLKDAAQNLDAAVSLAHAAIMTNMGECCVAGSRTYVHESIYEEFVRKSIDLAKSRIIGNPFDLNTQHGPQTTEDQLNIVLQYIENAKKEGAKLEYGGKRLNQPGYWMEPTILTGIEDGHTILREEVFGPVQLILPFKSLEEVAEKANNTEYGLAAGIFSNNLNEVNTLSRALRAGQIWVNSYLNLSARMPFGGFKMSGINRETGRDGYNAFTEVKSIMTKLPK